MESGARLVVIDSLNGYLNAMPGEKYLHNQLHELSSYLNQQGVVTILILAQHGLVIATESPVDISCLTDTVLTLRYFEAAGEVKRALAVVNAPWGRRAAQRLAVAKAAEKDFPREALALYREEVEQQIGQRNRQAYRDACGYLRKMRDLHMRLEDRAAWDAYVAGLRGQHRTLRAFQEELVRAKL